MDCVALKADMTELEQELRALEAHVEKMRGADMLDEELRDVIESVDADLSDSILKKYLKDFRRQNSELFPVFTLGEQVDIEDAEGRPANIEHMKIAGDGHVLIGGWDGAFYASSYDDQGRMALGRLIDIRNANGDLAHISSIAIANGGRVLVGGYAGTFYEGSYNERGELELGGRIDIRNVNGDPARICSVATTTDDGPVLIGGSDGVLYSAFYDDHGKLVPGEQTLILSNVSGEPVKIYTVTVINDDKRARALIGGDDGVLYSALYNDRGRLVGLDEQIALKGIDDGPACINTIAVANDGRHVLVGGDNGLLYEGSYDDEGVLKLGERIDVRNVDGYQGAVYSIVVTKDGYVLIGGDRGVFYEGSYDEQGKFTLGRRIDIINANGIPVGIRSIVAMDDGRVLIGGINGALYTGRCGINLETLKQHLPEIVKKGVA